MKREKSPSLPRKSRDSDATRYLMEPDESVVASSSVLQSEVRLWGPR